MTKSRSKKAKRRKLSTLNKKAALFTAFFVVLIDLIGFGIVLPGLEAYASGMHASPLFSGALYSSYSLAQLVFSPLWGSISDRIGRRPVMMLSTFGASVAYLLFAFSSSLWMLLLSRIFAGIMAGNIATAQAYVADVTEEKDRARGMGLIGAAFGVGFVIGPAIGGIVMKLDAAAPFRTIGFIAAALSALSFVLVFLRLPEPPRESRESASRTVKLSVFGSAFWAHLGKINAESGGALGRLFAGVFLVTLGQASIYVAFPYFCRTELGLPVSAVYHQYILMGLTAAFIQGGLIRQLVKRYSERALFRTGALLMGAALFVLPLAAGPRSLTAALFFMTVGASFAVPTLASLVSKQSAPQSYGLTMGISQSFAAMARAVGPSWGSALLGLSFRAPFMLTGALVMLVFWIGRGGRKAAN